MGKKGKYCAAKIGRIPGVDNNWEDCEKNTKGFSGAIHKAFTSESEAWKWVQLSAPTSTLALTAPASASKRWGLLLFL